MPTVLEPSVNGWPVIELPGGNVIASAINCGGRIRNGRGWSVDVEARSFDVVAVDGEVEASGISDGGCLIGRGIVRLCGEGMTCRLTCDLSSAEVIACCIGSIDVAACGCSVVN